MVSSDTLKTLLLLGYNIVAIQGSFVTNHQHVVSSGTNLFQVGGTKKADNKAMSFLKKIGRVGGARNVDFTNSMGVDEGPAGKTYYATKKSESFPICTESGVIDDLSESYPFTTSGGVWAGISDRVMGGVSSAKIGRETILGREANVLRGTVSLDNNGGFIQMATDLTPVPLTTVDASKYDGLELDLWCEASSAMESFNIQCVFLPTCDET
mmetsp:Transcript_2202/g.3156  ORF Transcript_2202/g.3156 Transcript_2202/m.3156 type:complete len:211 (-) Transcript_2202:2573-3205(-)